MYSTKKSFRTILTTRLLLECDKHFLFLEQTPLNGGGLTLPGGKIEKEEFAKEALIREAFEEIGMEITKKALRLIHVTHRLTDALSEIILFFYYETDTSYRPNIKEPHKFKNVLWVPSDEVPDALTGVLKHALELIKEDKFFSQFPKMKKKIDVLSVLIVDFNALEIERNAMKNGLGKLRKKTRKKMTLMSI